MTSRAASLYGAKISEKVDRYEDSVNFMKEVIEAGDELSADERNLLSVGYKNIVSELRNGWRNVDQDSKLKQKTPEDVMKMFRDHTDAEICSVCDEVVNLIDSKLLNPKLPLETTVFYLKMKGDYYRYKAETHDPKVVQFAAEKSHEFYEAATKEACKEGGLTVTDPTRLGLALNYAVFLCEIRDDKDKACQHAKKAFGEALVEISQCEDDKHRESSLIMQLLRDNLASWTNEMHEDESKDCQA